MSEVWIPAAALSILVFVFFTKRRSRLRRQPWLALLLTAGISILVTEIYLQLRINQELPTPEQMIERIHEQNPWLLKPGPKHWIPR